jgi:hypothetical protein
MTLKRFDKQWLKEEIKPGFGSVAGRIIFAVP